MAQHGLPIGKLSRRTGCNVDLTTGVFFEVHFDTVLGTDEEAFSVLHHTGRRALYGVRRRVN